MRKKTQRRMLAVITGENYTPNDAHREMVVLLKLNNVPNDRISTALGISTLTLEYFYAKELDLGVDALMAHAAKKVLWLANQTTDLGVSLRANEAILKPRVKAWREPHVDVVESIGDISELTLAEVEADIARLERQRGAAFDAQKASARADPDEEVVP
jgi:hypothetical protein